MEFVTCYYGPHSRGCWKRLRSLLGYIAAKGYRVHLFSHEYAGSRIDGIVHHEIPTENALLSPRHFIKLSQKALGEYSAELSSAIFFAFDLHNAYLLSKIAKTRLRTVFVRGLPKYHATLNNLTPGEQTFIEQASRRGIFSTDRLIFNSYASAKDFMETYGGASNHKVIYNNVPWSPNAPLARNNDDRQFRIGFVGQFIARKNPLFIVKSLRNLFVELNLRLLYKGRGELLSELRKYVADNELQEYVEFEDWGENVEEIYQKIDVLVVPSLYDECPNVVLEAFAHNVAVLGAQTGGITELLNSDDRLLFSITDDGVDLRTKITNIASSPQELSQVRALCNRCAESYDFDWGEKALEAILT